MESVSERVQAAGGGACNKMPADAASAQRQVAAKVADEPYEEALVAEHLQRRRRQQHLRDEELDEQADRREGGVHRLRDLVCSSAGAVRGGRGRVATGGVGAGRTSCGPTQQRIERRPTGAADTGAAQRSERFARVGGPEGRRARCVLRRHGRGRAAWGQGTDARRGRGVTRKCDECDARV